MSDAPTLLLHLACTLLSLSAMEVLSRGLASAHARDARMRPSTFRLDPDCQLIDIATSLGLPLAESPQMIDETTFGPYRLLEPLGEGGMGVVFRAVHTGTGQPVAVKTVRLPAPEWLDSIRREIHALTRIRHPGVVRILDHGVHRGRPWYAMEIVEGESLRHYYGRIWNREPAAGDRMVDCVGDTAGTETLDPFRRSDPGRATPVRMRSNSMDKPPAAGGALRSVLMIMRRLCATLAFLHGEGFVNADLKPENVLLLRDANPVIIDFGLTSSFAAGEGREILQASPGAAGTWAYMSPEQTWGEFLDARTDLYSIGCILYELITGRLPFTVPARRFSHLSSADSPNPPSDFVTGVPPELETLVFRLLEKKLPSRFGYADEAAAILAELSSDVHRLNYPSSRPYLYRPQFAGRDDVLAPAVALRSRAATGHGALLLVSGESGVGKTRFAMELTRFAHSNEMRVVTSECAALAPTGLSTSGSGSLSALRPLLQAIADRCQEGGPELTEQLLGARSAVLALYEPLLAQLPGLEQRPGPVPLPPEAARQRFFSFLSETIAAFARDRPLMLIMDDLPWADELSLEVLRYLSGKNFDEMPLLIIGTYRTEEITEPIKILTDLARTTNIHLDRLDENAVRSIVRDMLAIPAPPGAFIEYLALQTEGNPFFLAEYLRGAVNDRLISRDERGLWRIPEQHESEGVSYESLRLPSTLRDLILKRLQGLTPGAVQMLEAAAILGRETGTDLLLAVAGLADGESLEALNELMRRQILEQPHAGRIRFAHDKLREVAGERISRAVQLHRVAATSLESKYRERDDFNLLWGRIGYHFAAAHMPEEAVSYLARAAEKAKAQFANQEAIDLYRQAVAQINEIFISSSGKPALWCERYAQLYEALADVLLLVGKREDARSGYNEALASIPDETLPGKARLLRKLGKSWEIQHEHQRALDFYNQAEAMLGPEPWAYAKVRGEWVDLKMDQIWLNYWLGRVVEMQSLMQSLQPAMDDYATQVQRARFFQSQLLMSLRSDRYVVTVQTLRHARAAVSACLAAEDVAELPMVRFELGLALMLHGDCDDAAQELQAALRLAERAGDLALQTRCLTYLTVNARRAMDETNTSLYCNRSLAAASAAGMRDYVATAKANLSWLALRTEKYTEAVESAQTALEIWSGLSLVFPLQWTALVPLMEVRMSQRAWSDAVACAKALLDPKQQGLPEQAVAALSNAVEHFGAGDVDLTANDLDAALGHLIDTRHA